jgi:hypothetical protein
MTPLSPFGLVVVVCWCCSTPTPYTVIGLDDYLSRRRRRRSREWWKAKKKKKKVPI